MYSLSHLLCSFRSTCRPPNHRELNISWVLSSLFFFNYFGVNIDYLDQLYRLLYKNLVFMLICKHCNSLSVSHIICFVIQDELKRGDVSKSIQCYMKETGASEEDAREYISPLISATWKKMNEERISNSPFSKMYLEVVMNLARMAQCTYQHGDGHGVQDCDNKDHVLSLLIHPIPLNRDQIKNVTIFKETKYEWWENRMGSLIKKGYGASPLDC